MSTHNIHFYGDIYCEDYPSLIIKYAFKKLHFLIKDGINLHSYQVPYGALIISGQTTLLKLFGLPSKMGSTLKWRNLLFWANSLLFKKIPFQKGYGVHECKQEVTIVVPLVKKSWKIYQVYQCLLTHCRLNRLSHTIYWKSPISILDTSGYVKYSKRKMAKLFANSGDADQTLRSSASDLGLHCLPIALLRVSGLKRVKHQDKSSVENKTGQ